MLDANLKTQLKTYLEKLTRPIELVASVDDSAKSQELLALLNDVASLSARVTVIERRGDEQRKPSFSIGEPGKASGIRFAGIPMGHEFTSLVLALLQTGGHPIKLDDAVIQQIRELDGDYQFETYISLSCQNCPEVVQALNVMALINPRIRHVAIDGAVFQNEVEARQIMAVPTMFLNGCTFNGTSSITKTGTTGDYSVGGNVFTGICNIINNGSSYFLLGNVNPDIWNTDVTFSDNGSERLLPCWASPRSPPRLAHNEPMTGATQVIRFQRSRSVRFASTT